MHTTGKTTVPGENVPSVTIAVSSRLIRQTPIDIAGQVRLSVPREIQLESDSDLNLGPSFSRSQLSTENGGLLIGHHGENDAEDALDPPEPGENRAFLHEHEAKEESADHAKTRGQGSHVALLAAWWMEATSVAAATAALIAIVVTLVQYNNKEQPTWKGAINLNTLIAILSTLMRACMVVVAEEGETSSIPRLL